MRTLVISSRVSNSATALSRALGLRKLALTGNKKARPIRLLNWGCGTTKFNERYMSRLLHRTTEGAQFINSPAAVAVATNKLLTFQALSQHEDIPIPEFTIDKGIARTWDAPIVGRAILTGHSGEGIVITPMQENPPNAPLYVKYMKKKHEYRVHVIGGHTDVQQKRKRQETPNEEVDYKVRNHANGWVYCREQLETPRGMEALAIRTVSALGLDFGAVDIIWNQHQDELTVLEVNTAPGLEGQTLDFYSNNLRGLL